MTIDDLNKLRALCDAVTKRPRRTMSMCGVDGCVYVEGHGGEHLPPDGSRDLSDEIRLRLARDQRDQLTPLVAEIPGLIAEVERLRALCERACKVADGLVDLAAPGLDTFRDLAITDITEIRASLRRKGG